MIIKKLEEKSLISPPRWLTSNIIFECIMGSFAYGVSSDTSDCDVYSVCIPNKEVIFPHLAGEILGFSTPKNRFDQFQQHHINDIAAAKNYDVTCYNIVKYFRLLMDNNPNIINSLFVPRECITHISRVGEIIRENRVKFLHKGAWFKFKGYSYSQMTKMKNVNKTGKRKELVDKYKFDIKNGYHVVRLLLEIEQILIDHDLDLQRNKELLKSIRKGEWSIEKIIEFAESKEKDLEAVYIKSNLPNKPNEENIKSILLECLEKHYGKLNDAIIVQDKYINMINEIRKIVN